ncbi:hypothetical protein ACFW2D_36585 [Streptomyces sp. NPDC058914]
MPTTPPPDRTDDELADLEAAARRLGAVATITEVRQLNRSRA